MKPRILFAVLLAVLALGTAGPVAAQQKSHPAKMSAAKAKAFYPRFVYLLIASFECAVFKVPAQMEEMSRLSELLYARANASSEEMLKFSAPAKAEYNANQEAFCRKYRQQALDFQKQVPRYMSRLQ